MSKSLVDIDNTNTFGLWKDRTNEIIAALKTVVTIGDSEENDGNIVIDGDIRGTGTLRINTIQANALNTISINADLSVSGLLQLKSASAGDSEIKLYKGNDLTWTIGTSTTHADFNIKRGDAFLRIGNISGTSGTIIGSTNLKLDAGLLPATIGSDTTGKAAKADEWTTGRTITLTGDVTGTSAPWTGNGNISFVTTVADNSHDHTVANITGLSTTLGSVNTTLGSLTDSLSLKLNLAGGTMTGNLLVGSNVNVQLGTTSGATTSMKRGTFGTVTDAFSITTTGINASTYISLPGAGSAFYIANGTTPRTSIDSGGNIVTVGDITAFGSVSDINRKENVAKISNALDKIKKVSGYTYNYIGDSTRMTGVVAQEFDEILPEVVYNTVLMDGTVSKAVRHGNIVGLLIEAIKELEIQIQELKNGK
jgi:hypothetical protein